MKTHLITSLKVLLLLTLILGILYPLLITGLSQILFPKQANGSFLFKSGKAIGSELIGQAFSSPAYFHPRPSATGYNPIPSAASNYGMNNRILVDSSQTVKNRFIRENYLSDSIVPSEMIYSSASGLDPDISVRSALLQVRRIAEYRKVSPSKIYALIDRLRQARQFNFLGEERINVLVLNLNLDLISNP
jgi:potassium-transporting ATPase KdpC subunit